ncbi:MAG: cytochrome c biogenesis protein CcdA [Coleofasciculaceae cyanobacterium SM2_1_6]|nr:cytochrome c biogenesis protein CcdA [Coleofasciculaceae cyanobacterium SM2_1_6]
MANNLSIALAVAAGVLSTLSPCVLPVLPIVVSRSLRSHPFGPVALVTGLALGFAMVGSLLGITANWVTGLANFLRWAALSFLIILGVLAIFPQKSYQLFSYLPRWGQPREIFPAGSLLGEFWLGVYLGWLWTPCAGVVLGSIITLAAVEGQIREAFGLLLAYGGGAALPLLAIAYGGRHLSKYLGQQLSFLRSQSQNLQKVGGVVIVGTAIAILLGWDIKVQLWLAPFFPALPLLITH